jgi:RNA-directed DNA polymerase
MRSVPAGSFQRLTSFKALWRAWLACRRGKRRQPGIAAFDLDADRHLLRLRRELVSDAYRPRPYRVSLVRDPKTRLIAAPAIRDRVLQQALLADIGPAYERGFIDQHYACGTGRGPHRALLQCLRCMRRFRYRLALDIRHYFASVDLARLLALFEHRLRDEDTLKLIRCLLAAGAGVYRTTLARRLLGEVPPGRGLPLGGLLSHWCGAFYLDGLDHHIKRGLKVSGYLRYMDDLVLFSDSSAVLEAWRADIADWLRRERGLRLKNPAARVIPNSQPATLLGFRVSRAGALPGPKMKRRLQLRLAAADALTPGRLARGLMAYRGVLTPF